MSLTSVTRVSSCSDFDLLLDDDSSQTSVASVVQSVVADVLNEPSVQHPETTGQLRTLDALVDDREWEDQSRLSTQLVTERSVMLRREVLLLDELHLQGVRGIEEQEGAVRAESRSHMIHAGMLVQRVMAEHRHLIGALTLVLYLAANKISI
jgi:hypothetical protein